jgi:hypothetical protein
VPTTIRDVAAMAVVSPATVSRVLNGKQDVDPDLRRRVLGAVTELGYRRNGPARSLRTRAAMVLGVIISDITNPFFTAVVRGAEDQAQLAGYSVVLANADEDVAKEARYLEVAAAEQMAGALLSPASPKQTSIDVLLERGIPVVTIDRRLALPEQVPGGCIAALGPEVAVGDERGISRAPGVAQGRPVPCQPTGAGRGLERPGDEPDPAAALGDQVLRRLARSPLVVDHDAVDRCCCQPPVNGHHGDPAF